jgi:tRNA pseudouridine32 synthase/23S rRNA pseudouridine746 synthase
LKQETTSRPSALHFFNEDVSSIPLPSKFTYPFYYDPHPLAKMAVLELQEYLENQTDFTHNFGLNKKSEGLEIGKMFGVLVVQNELGKLGYLAAFSGKLAGHNDHNHFVPPIFNMFSKDGFFLKEEQEINKINEELEKLEESSVYKQQKSAYLQIKEQGENEISQLRAEMREGKKQRKKHRQDSQLSMTQTEYNLLLEELSNESIQSKFALRDLSDKWNDELSTAETKLDELENKIRELRDRRAKKSAQLQQKLFNHYIFLNQYGEEKSLSPIFENTATKKPPAGSGECAAPKLLQYAFENKLTPIALAEFWWGASPSSEIRKHRYFYPACQGKCKPILGHMLKDIELDNNPMLQNPGIDKPLEFIFEDDQIIIVNKPPEVLSVPGKSIEDSVYSRIKEMYPSSTGPLLVHRLDMSTSGLLIIAKDIDSHKYIQRQFIKRTIEKRYIALLDGYLKKEKGEIDLPLILDVDDRPRQMVDFEYGKSAKTNWEVIERRKGYTRIHFYPVTGRTHQLRVHASHPKGLNTPIIGDDLYGKKGDRLHLHSAFISFTHPKTRQKVTFEVEAPF